MNLSILLYHKITHDNEKTNDNFSISSSDFKNQIKYLKNKNYKTITQNDLLNIRPNKTKFPEKVL